MTRELSKTFSIIGVISIVIASVNASAPCDLKETKYGHICLCTADYCDFLDDPTPENEADFVIVSSTKEGLRFEKTDGKFKLFEKYFILDYNQRQGQQQMPENLQSRTGVRQVRLDVDRAKQYQKITGFGGSFPGAVSYILDQLPQALQDNIYESYYSQRGIGFNLMRIPIGGCDFDLSPWAYNEEPQNDPELTNFKELDPRDLQKVAQIKRLMQVSKLDKLKIKGAAWSAPPWMKTNNKWTGHSRLKQEYYQTWANYHLRWLELMEENGLPIWAISTGNEPLNGAFFMFFIKFMSLGWTPKKQAVWVSENLGPTIRNSKFKDLIIFGNDDQRYTFPFWFNQMRSSRKDSVDYLDGLAVHWYWDEIFKPFFIDEAHKQMPDKILINTESCIGDKPWQKAAPLLGSWARGEKYARAFLQDLQHGFNGWIDWNIVLDEKGGPNYVDNTVDAPVIVNVTNRAEVYKQPMFYTIGHFSKFIPEGSVRIDVKRTNINVDTVAFLRPDATIAAVVFNSGSANVELNLADSVRGTIIVNLPPRSIHTIIYK